LGIFRALLKVVAALSSMSTRRDLTESPYLAAVAGRKPSRVPVWFMRQAGRSLPEYRALRERHSMLAACLEPEVACEITLQPIRRHGVDAAILFSDIVVPLRAAGVELDIVADVGPVIAHPVRTDTDIEAMKPLEPQAIQSVCAAVSLLVAELGDVPLIGFAGAPFTLASYLVEGGPSRTHARTKAMMLAEPASWHALMSKLTDLTVTFLRGQIEAGVDAIQVFDSWAGTLSLADYRRYVLPHSSRVFAALAECGVPMTHFGVGTAELLGAMSTALKPAASTVVGVDWRTSLTDAAARVDAGTALQGNLDPAVLLAGWPVVDRAARAVVDDGRCAVDAGAAGHVFNLGHGVLPETDPGVLTELVSLVHSL
jgi:uroporphyrinogen decarboxylase